MRLLLDTNAFLRWTGGGPVPAPARRALQKPGTECYVSIVTAWEIAMKASLGLTTTQVESGIAGIGTLLPIRFQHLDELSMLPEYRDHADPFDRLLIAQAISEDLRIVSADMRFADYKKLRVIWD